MLRWYKIYYTEEWKSTQDGVPLCSRVRQSYFTRAASAHDVAETCAHLPEVNIVFQPHMGTDESPAHREEDCLS